MGEVYLAEDTKLARKVALKLLYPKEGSDEHARKRLIREARATAQLEHTNICTVYEVGEEADYAFIAMQYVEGETLATILRTKHLQESEYLDIAIQVANALSEAHRHGIIHRDIKPQNIIITVQGLAKLMDFGLASIDHMASSQSLEDTVTLLTDPGWVVGTVPYMSPEQLKAETLDGRTDIFSFGTVLYEMISGRQPFAARSSAETVSAILTLDPPPLSRFNPDIPSELQRIVAKALAKNRERRYQTAEEVLTDLRSLKKVELEGKANGVIGEDHPPSKTTRLVYDKTEPNSLIRYVIRHWIGLAAAASILLITVIALMIISAGGKTEIDSVAIVPYSNASDNPSLEYLSDGIAEGLIINLSQLPRLKVISRASSFRYRPPEMDPGEIGHRLKVKAVVIVRVTQINDKLGISLEVVDPADSRQIWGAQYERTLSDILTVQSEMSKLISEKLRLRLSGHEQMQVTRRYTDNVNAYQLYLQGRFYYHKLTEEGVNRSIQYYKRALAEDDQFALAYAGMSLAYTTLGANYVPPRQAMEDGKTFAIKARELDDSLAEAHLSLADIKYGYDWDWSGSEVEFKRALELDPNCTSAYQGYGYLMEARGRLPEAIDMMNRAVALDPLSLIACMNLATAYYYAGQYDQAIAGYRKALELDSNFYYATLSIANIYAIRGMREEALAALNSAISMPGDNPLVRAAIAQVFARTGKVGEAQTILNSLLSEASRKYIRPYEIAAIYAALGKQDQAFVWLQRALEEHSTWILKLGVDPQFSDLRKDSKFKELLRSIQQPR